MESMNYTQIALGIWAVAMTVVNIIFYSLIQPLQKKDVELERRLNDLSSLVTRDGNDIEWLKKNYNNTKGR